MFCKVSVAWLSIVMFRWNASARARGPPTEGRSALPDDATSALRCHSFDTRRGPDGPRQHVAQPRGLRGRHDGSQEGPMTILDRTLDAGRIRSDAARRAVRARVQASALCVSYFTSRFLCQVPFSCDFRVPQRPQRGPLRIDRARVRWPSSRRRRAPMTVLDPPPRPRPRQSTPCRGWVRPDIVRRVAESAAAPSPGLTTAIADDLGRRSAMSCRPRGKGCHRPTRERASRRGAGSLHARVPRGRAQGRSIWLAVGITAGVGAGVVAAALLDPKHGKERREALRRESAGATDRSPRTR